MASRWFSLLRFCYVMGGLLILGPVLGLLILAIVEYGWPAVALLVYVFWVPRTNGMYSGMLPPLIYTLWSSALNVYRKIGASSASSNNECKTNGSIENRQESGDVQLGSNIYTQKVNQDVIEDISGLFTTNENDKPEQIFNRRIQDFRL